MKRGFTLIELLAVIVILAIIALIAVPIIINIVNDAKEESLKRSVDNYANIVEQAVYRYMLKAGKSVFGSFTTTDGHKLTQGNISIDVDYKGNVVCDNIVVNEKGKIFIGSCTVDGKKIDYSVGEMKYNVLTEDEIVANQNESSTTDTGIFLNTEVLATKVSKFEINTKGTNIPDGYSSVDCSYYKNKSVMCYWKEDLDNPGYYEMHIAANGDVYAPKDSTGLFESFGYDKLENLDLTGLNTSYVENMKKMFNGMGYTSMISLNLGDKFDTSKVTNMYAMFQNLGYTKLQNLDLGDKFDTSNVTDMTAMFSKAGYISMTSLDLGDKFNTSKVTNMYLMFRMLGYTKLQNLDLGDKFNTSKVTNMQSMFYQTGYKSMTSLDLGDKFDTSNVTGMYAMFNQTGYTSMTNLNLGNKFDTSNVTSMYAMFNQTGYESMTSLNLGSNFIISNETNIEGIFYNCGTSGKLTQVIVPNQELKTKILSLGTDKVPEFWSTNNIITVPTN